MPACPPRGPLRGEPGLAALAVAVPGLAARGARDGFRNLSLPASLELPVQECGGGQEARCGEGLRCQQAFRTGLLGWGVPGVLTAQKPAPAPVLHSTGWMGVCTRPTLGPPNRRPPAQQSKPRALPVCLPPAPRSPPKGLPLPESARGQAWSGSRWGRRGTEGTSGPVRDFAALLLVDPGVPAVTATLPEASCRDGSRARIRWMQAAPWARTRAELGSEDSCGAAWTVVPWVPLGDAEEPMLGRPGLAQVPRPAGPCWAALPRGSLRADLGGAALSVSPAPGAWELPLKAQGPAHVARTSRLSPGDRKEKSCPVLQHPWQHWKEGGRKPGSWGRTHAPVGM